jgi:hypothetical protein
MITYCAIFVNFSHIGIKRKDFGAQLGVDLMCGC